mgnify:CR=1 FL=1|jgi:hypothetical protein
MSAADVDAHLAECRAILGGLKSKTGRIWDNTARLSDRRLMLALAGWRGSMWSSLVERRWQELPADLRSKVDSGMRRFKAWADEICQEEVQS